MEQVIGSSQADEWTLDYPQITKDWNFEVIYEPGKNVGRLWKMELRDTKTDRLIQTYYPEDLDDKGNGRYEYEIRNPLTLDGYSLKWYSMHYTERGVEVVSYLQENNDPPVPNSAAGSGAAYNGNNPVSIAVGGSFLTLVANPNPGYAFKRWEVVKGYSFIIRGDELNLNSDTRVAAIFMPVTQCVVTFNPQGGMVSPSTANPNAEGKFTSLPTPTRSGYSFQGWYDEDGNPFTTSTVVKRNMTVYARWDSGFYVESTEIDFGRVLEGYGELPHKQIKVRNLYDEAVWPITYDSDNYLLTYVSISPNTTGNLHIRPSNNLAPGNYDRTMYVGNNKDSGRYPVKLKLEVVPSHTITFNPMSGVADFTEAKTNINGRLDAFPDAKRAGYRLLGWYDSAYLNSDGGPIGNRCESTMQFSGPTTLYAFWEKLVSLDKQVLDFGTVKKRYSPVDPQMVVVRNASEMDVEIPSDYSISFYDPSTQKNYSGSEGPYLVSWEESELKSVEMDVYGDSKRNQAFKLCYRPKDNLPPGEYNFAASIGWNGKEDKGSVEWFDIKFKVEDADPDPYVPQDDGEKRVMQMGTAGIEQLHTIYYGRNYTNLTYDDGFYKGFHYDEAVPSWYVVDKQKDILGDLGGMYLLAKTLYGCEGGGLIPYNGFMQLDGSTAGAERWQSSVMGKCFNVLWDNNFSSLEKDAVRNIQKTEEGIDESNEEGKFFYMENTVNHKLFPLSMNEAVKLPEEIVKATYKGETHNWWLRSIERIPYKGDYFNSDGGVEISIIFIPIEGKKKFEEDNSNNNLAPQLASAPALAAQKGPYDGPSYVCLPWVCGTDGHYRTEPENSAQGVRPAMNIGTGSVFMSSAAVGGKETGPLGSGALRKVRKSNPTEWKLTLIDTQRTGFTVAVDGYTPATSNSINVNRRVINSGAVMTIHYSGAPTGPNEFVSVVLKRSSDNEVLYYGTIAANRASGDVTIPIPNDLETDQLHEVLIFSEQKNGDYYTDYVGPVVTYYIQMEKTEVTLYDDDYVYEEGYDPWNATIIDRNKGFETKYVKISDRTLYRDGRWNTICLPFNLASFDGTLLEGATVKQLVSSDYTPSTLTLNFETVEAMEAGKPYIVRWPSEAKLEDVTSPVFNGVTISDVAAGVTETEHTDFIGLYSSIYIGGLDRTMLYLGGDNKLYYPNDEMFINSFRGYFRLKGGLWASDRPGTTDAKAFVVHLGDDGTTGITAVDGGESADDSWYSIDGKKLKDKPVQKGVYVRNGRKVVIQ